MALFRKNLKIILVLAFLMLLGAFVRCLTLEQSVRVSQLMGENRELEIQKRIENYSAYFLGVPHHSGDPLGEGERGIYDQDPLYRFDTFNCTTFVETVSAMALAETFEEFEENINRVRYKTGEIGFIKRNHFTSLEWVPNNTEMGWGWMKEITEEIAPGETEVAEAEIDRKAWYENLKEDRIQLPQLEKGTPEFEQKLSELRSEGERFVVETARISYIPLDAIFKKRLVSEEELERREKVFWALDRRYWEEVQSVQSEVEKELLEKKWERERRALELNYRISDSLIDDRILKAIPSGAIVNIVRPNWDLVEQTGTHLNVSHQGFAIWRGKTLYYRHPSSFGPKKVVDMPMIEYLQRYLLSSTLKGIHIILPVKST